MDHADTRNSAVDLGVLLLRLGVGIMFIVVHGGPKLFGGPEMWSRIGIAMGHLGIQGMPAVWGFFAACAEFFGGWCLLLGIFTKPAALFMAITMLVATTMHLMRGDGIGVASHAIEDGIVFVSLLLLGPGRYRLRLGRDRQPR